jgi:hypothetical protein
MLTPPLLEHLSGPLPSGPHVAVSIRDRADRAPQGPGSVVYLWPEGEHKRLPDHGNLSSIDVENKALVPASE